MTDKERETWDERYRSGAYRARRESGAFLERWVETLPAGRALDVACGTGRHAFRLAEAGLAVEAIDISEVAIARARAEADERGLAIDWAVADLDHLELTPARYDVITVIRYVNRELWPRLVDALRPGGTLLIEHHLRTDADVVGPRTEAFRLAPQELLRAFTELRVVFYEEALEPADDPTKCFALARMVAVKGAPAWDSAPAD